jgi:hypothetical protein
MLTCMTSYMLLYNTCLQSKGIHAYVHDLLDGTPKDRSLGGGRGHGITIKKSKMSYLFACTYTYVFTIHIHVCSCKPYLYSCMLTYRKQTCSTANMHTYMTPGCGGGERLIPGGAAKRSALPEGRWPSSRIFRRFRSHFKMALGY